MKWTKQAQPAFDGYSRSCKYTETFFHHPTKNNHYQAEYEKKKGNKETNTFRAKKAPQYKEYLLTSSLNQFPAKKVRPEKIPYEGQKKMLVDDQSFKKTDPISLRFEPGVAKVKTRAPFEGSLMVKADVERRFYLPAERQLSRSHRSYHSQLGLSLQRSKVVTPRSVINSSMEMRQTIQYNSHPLNRTMGSLDDFRYNSRR